MAFLLRGYGQKIGWKRGAGESVVQGALVQAVCRCHAGNKQRERRKQAHEEGKRKLVCVLEQGAEGLWFCLLLILASV